ncbi:MAG: rRNA maturation RNase YbeY [Aliishimia sp.]
MMIELDMDDGRWDGLRLDILAQTAIAQTLVHLSILHDHVEISVLACDDARIGELNREFRGKATPTNVLSWPAEDVRPPALPTADPDGSLPLGDIAIAYETCEREANAADKPFSAHVTHLIVHGTLHLLGYDHEVEAEAAQMEAIETEILGKLGLPDPYL